MELEYNGYQIEVSVSADRYSEFTHEYHISQHGDCLVSGQSASEAYALSDAKADVDDMIAGVF